MECRRPDGPKREQCIISALNVCLATFKCDVVTITHLLAIQPSMLLLRSRNPRRCLLAHRSIAGMS